MPTAYIVEAVRTAGGKRGGRLAGWHPADLAGAGSRTRSSSARHRSGAIDDVIMGCVSQVGEQAGHVARNAVLASKLPESVPRSRSTGSAARRSRRCTSPRRR